MISSNESKPLQQQDGKPMTQSENKENIPQAQAQVQDMCYEKNQDQDQTLSSKEVLVEEAPNNKDISSLVFSDSKAKLSLQENFKKFRKERNDKCKSHVNLRNKRIKERHTKEFQQELREKFVETAKKYLGVPYAKRHLTPEDPNYNSPLFLDCCGLVRRVMTDLKEDFGFQIGGWNQAYQFDTLPNEVPFEELKPGDLIFYSGTYFNPKKRKQKHDMVHVEIFLGGPTGEQTIGARYFKGVVSIFDSYKFNSKTYYDIKFYYRSLDTWLQGICKSACEEHLWLEDRDFYDSGKFSVFADADADASDDDEEVAKETDNKAPKITKNKADKGIKKIFIGKGNNDKLIKSYFAKE